MHRRKLLAGAGLLAVTGRRPATAAPVADAADIERLQKEWETLLAPGAEVARSTAPLARSRAEWRAALAPAAYRVLFEEDTERPFTSPLNEEKRPGVFVCRACNLPLFSSAMKYDSGTGWPSFFTSIPGHLDTKIDLKLIWPRTEYHCVKCGGHQGHVFDDGPPPTHQRWCNNGVALRFIPKEG